MSQSHCVTMLLPFKVSFAEHFAQAARKNGVDQTASELPFALSSVFFVTGSGIIEDTTIPQVRIHTSHFPSYIGARRFFREAAEIARELAINATFNAPREIPSVLLKSPRLPNQLMC